MCWEGLYGVQGNRKGLLFGRAMIPILHKTMFSQNLVCHSRRVFVRIGLLNIMIAIGSVRYLRQQVLSVVYRSHDVMHIIVV